MRSARPRTAGEDGFTLVELLIAATLMLLVLTASLGALVRVDRGQREVASRTDELSRARQGVERMTREIRQASVVKSVTATSLTVNTLVHKNGAAVPVKSDVTYTCGDNACFRKSDADASSCTMPPTATGTRCPVVVPNVRDANVFSWTTNSGAVNFVGLNVAIKTRSTSAADGTVTLNDGVDLRNSTA